MRVRKPFGWFYPLQMISALVSSLALLTSLSMVSAEIQESVNGGNEAAVIDVLLNQYGSVSIRPGRSRDGNDRPDLVEVQFYVDVRLGQ